MDTKSTPGDTKKMVRCTMKHAGYQGLMTGETIFGISLINREVAPTPGGGTVSLRTILFSYIKMQADKFSPLQSSTNWRRWGQNSQSFQHAKKLRETLI